MGAGTAVAEERGGQYGLFCKGVPYGSASTMSAWIDGLQQNEGNRSNLALVKTVDSGSSDPDRTAQVFFSSCAIPAGFAMRSNPAPTYCRG